MTARQPRRTRRRVAPATALPRPVSGDEATQAARTSEQRRASALHHRQHHVTKDYSHVHKDLLTVVGVTIVVFAFIFGMSFVVN